MTTRLLVIAPGNSVLSEHAQVSVRNAYTAHGHRSPDGGQGRPGFRGEYLEPAGVQLLGSYRAYNPVLMRFHSPDSLSPFGEGGLNAYAYCLGDPINRIDPSGHLPRWVIPALGIGLSVMGLGLAVAGVTKALETAYTGAMFALHTTGASLGVSGAAVGVTASILQTDPQNELGKTLGLVSLGLGAASLLSGMAARALHPRVMAKEVGRRAVAPVKPLQGGIHDLGADLPSVDPSLAGSRSGSLKGSYDDLIREFDATAGLDDYFRRPRQFNHPMTNPGSSRNVPAGAPLRERTTPGELKLDGLLKTVFKVRKGSSRPHLGNLPW